MEVSGTADSAVPVWLATALGWIAPGAVLLYAGSNHDPYLLGLVIFAVLLAAPASAVMLSLSLRAVQGRASRALHWIFLIINVFLCLYFWIPFLVSILLVIR